MKPWQIALFLATWPVLIWAIVRGVAETWRELFNPTEAKWDVEWEEAA